MKITTLRTKYSNTLPSTFSLLIPVAVACFALVPQARAACQNGCDLTHSNTFLGDDALISNTNGSDNTAIGAHALDSDTSGQGNVAVGSQALSGNSTGSFGTAIGLDALQSNTNGYGNSAFGADALYSNTTGRDNVAVGLSALYSNTGGYNNTAIGAGALESAQGGDNVAVGYSALNNASGGANVAIGSDALWNLETGSGNIALGDSAGYNLENGSNNIIIGTRGVAADDGLIRIGTASTHHKAFIAGISGVTVASGVGVLINTRGQLGTIVSSERYKENIKAMDKASEAILALKPVTFRYKRELDPERIPQFGLVAEDVEKVNPDLVARDDEGKPYTVRYEAVNAMLLNEFLKEHRKVEELQANAVRLEKQIETLAAGLQQVSTQLDLNKTAPLIVVGNH
jgi:hypothetical protein